MLQILPKYDANDHSILGEDVWYKMYIVGVAYSVTESEFWHICEKSTKICQYCIEIKVKSENESMIFTYDIFKRIST